MRSVVLLLLWTAVLAIADAETAPDQDNEFSQGLSRRFSISSLWDFNRRCVRLSGYCFRNSDCCSNHCGIRPAIRPPVPGRCEAPFSTQVSISAIATTRPVSSSPVSSVPVSPLPSSRPSSLASTPSLSSRTSQQPTSCRPYLTTSTITQRTGWVSGGTTWMSLVLSTTTLSYTPSTCTSSATTTPCEPSYSTTLIRDVMTRTLNGKPTTFTVTTTAIAVFDPPCAFGPFPGPTPITTPTVSNSITTPATATSTTPCEPTYSTFTLTELYATTVRGRATTLTTTTTDVATIDPPCAFGYGGDSTVPSPYATTPPAQPTYVPPYNPDCGLQTIMHYEYHESTTTVRGSASTTLVRSPVYETISFYCPPSSVSSSNHLSTHMPIPVSTTLVTSKTPASCPVSTQTLTFTNTFTTPYRTTTVYALAHPPCSPGHSTNTNTVGPIRTIHTVPSPTLITSTISKSSSSSGGPLSSPTTTRPRGGCDPVTNTFPVTSTTYTISGRSTIPVTIVSTRTIVIDPLCITLGPGPVVLSSSSSSSASPTPTPPENYCGPTTTAVSVTSISYTVSGTSTVPVTVISPRTVVIDPLCITQGLGHGPVIVPSSTAT